MQKGFIVSHAIIHVDQRLLGNCNHQNNKGNKITLPHAHIIGLQYYLDLLDFNENLYLASRYISLSYI